MQLRQILNTIYDAAIKSNLRNVLGLFFGGGESCLIWGLHREVLDKRLRKLNCHRERERQTDDKDRPWTKLGTLQGNKYYYYFFCYNMQTLVLGTHIIAITYR